MNRLDRLIMWSKSKKLYRMNRLAEKIIAYQNWTYLEELRQKVKDLDHHSKDYRLFIIDSMKQWKA